MDALFSSLTNEMSAQRIAWTSPAMTGFVTFFPLSSPDLFRRSIGPNTPPHGRLAA
jgi:hypothetical protein